MKVCCYLILLFISVTKTSYGKNLSDASLWLQEKYSRKTCGDINKEDFEVINQITNYKSKTCDFKIQAEQNLQDFNAIAESLFFERMAGKLYDETTCALSNIDYFAKDEILIKIRADEISNNLEFLKQQKKLEKQAYFDLYQIIQQNNHISASCRNSMGEVRKQCLLELDQKKSIEKQAEQRWTQRRGIVVAIISSFWHGSTETMPKLINDLVKMDPLPSKELVFEKLKKIIPKVKNEILDNQLELYKQSNTNKRNLKFNDLNPETKSILVELATLDGGLFQEAAIKNDPSAIKFLCRLEGRYTTGKNLLNKAIGSSTLFIGGGAGILGTLLSKIPIVFRAGQMANFISKAKPAAAVLASGFAGIEGSLSSFELINKCILSTAKYNIKNACAQNPVEYKELEVKLTQDNHCILNVAKSITPAGIFVTSKLVKGILTKVDPVSIEKVFDKTKKTIEQIPESLEVKFDPKLISEVKLSGIDPNVLNILLEHSSGISTLKELKSAKDKPKGILYGLSNQVNLGLKSIAEKTGLKNFWNSDAGLNSKINSAENGLARLVDKNEPIVFWVPRRIIDSDDKSFNQVLADFNWLLEDPDSRMKNIKFVFGPDEN